MFMYTAQLKAARALLGIEQKDLANMTGLSLPTIKRMESNNLHRLSEGHVYASADSLILLRETLHREGVRFFSDGPDMVGVLLIRRTD